MHRLAILRFCRDELAERQKGDKWQGWFWGIRRKVIDYWIAVLERDSTDIKQSQWLPQGNAGLDREAIHTPRDAGHIQDCGLLRQGNRQRRVQVRETWQRIGPEDQPPGGMEDVY